MTIVLSAFGIVTGLVCIKIGAIGIDKLLEDKYLEGYRDGATDKDRDSIDGDKIFLAGIKKKLASKKKITVQMGE